MRAGLCQIIAATALAGGVLGPLSGCVSAAPPRAEVVGARVTEAAEFGVALDIILHLTSADDQPMPLPQVSYTVKLEGADEPFEAIDLPVSVIPPAPGGDRILRLPAAVAVASGQGLSGRRWSVNGTLTYSPESGLRTFLTESGLPLPVVYFSGHGQLD